MLLLRRKLSFCESRSLGVFLRRQAADAVVMTTTTRISQKTYKLYKCVELSPTLCERQRQAGKSRYTPSGIEIKIKKRRFFLMKKRIVSLIMAVFMVLEMLPMAVLQQRIFHLLQL